MKLRLFISHTTKDGAGEARLNALKLALQEVGFDVLIDVDILELGNEWRKKLYTWLGLCDVALVLISPRALAPSNPWVAREASILMWRKALDPNFQVVPVLLDGVEPSQLEEGMFRDLLLSEMQSKFVQSDDQHWMSDVAGRLQSLAGQSASNPVDMLAGPIAQQLLRLDNTLLREAAEQIDIDLGPWAKRSDLAHQMAIQMLHLGVEDAFPALDFLASQGVEASCLEPILEMIAPSWVDLCAARSIAHAAQRGEGKPALLLNAESDFAASMYIRRASGRPPRADWPRVVITPAFGEQGIEDLERYLREALKAKLRIIADPLSANEDARLNNLLERHRANGRPIFVVSRYTLGLSRHIAELKARYPALTFLTLGGLDEGDEPLSSSFERVLPALADGEEDEARECYDYHRALLGGVN